MKVFKKTISVIMLVVLIMTAAPLSGIADIDFAGLLEKAFAANVSSDEYKVVINWSASPRDLDSHLEGFDSDGRKFHVYFSDQYAYDTDNTTIAWLDQDITSGFGPETLKFTPVDSSRRYTYYIYNFGGDGRISNSQAKVSLYKGDTLIGEYIPPSNDGLYWTLFYVQNGNVYLVNKIGDSVNSQDGSILDYKLNANRNDIVISTYGKQIVDQDGPFIPNDKKKIYENLSGVQFGFENGTTQTADESQYTIKADNPCDNSLVLTHSGFRDYIIPSAVLKSWKAAENVPVTKSNPGYHHNAYMVSCANNGKPYISTVFGRNKNSDPFVEITTSDLSLTENSDSYVYVTAGNLNNEGCMYYIEQDASHKVSNTTGAFKVSELYEKLDAGKTAYAFVVTDSGRQSYLESLSIKKESIGIVQQVYNEYISKSTLNLLGNDFAKITISDNIPIVGGAEISFNAFKLPAGFELEGNTIKMSVGANIFNSEKGNDDEEYKKEMFKDWKDLVDNITAREAIDNTIQSQKETAAKFKTNKDVFCSKWGGVIPHKSSKNWDLDAIGYIEMFVTDSGITIKEASISVAGKFTFKYNVQASVGPVPVYCYLEAGASVGASASGARPVADTFADMNFDITFSISPKVSIGGGVGISGVVSAGVYGSAEMPIMISARDWHFTMGLNGSVGLEGQIGLFSSKIEIWNGSRTLVDTYWGNSPRRIVRYNSQISPNADESVSYSLIDRNYLSSTSDWLGENFSTRRKIGRLGKNGLSLTALQTDVFPNAFPQIVSFGDKMLMTWIEDDSSRDEYNRMRLMYSIFENGVWKEPKPVYDDGHNDNVPMIVSDGSDVYFAWQKTNKILSSNDSLEDMIKNTEIYCAKYNSDRDTICDVRRISNNSNYDYSHSISIINGKAVVYWAECSADNLISGNNNSLNRYEFGGESEVVKDNLGYIIKTAAASVDGKEQAALVVDTRSDDEEIDGIDVFTITDSVMSAYSDDDTVYSDIFYGDLNSKTTLFVSDMNNIFYKDNGDIVSVFNSDRVISGDVQFIANDESNILLWTESESVGNAVYSSSYENGEWTAPIKVSSTKTNLESVDAVIYNGVIRGVCTSTTYKEGQKTDDGDFTSVFSANSGESRSSVYDEPSTSYDEPSSEDISGSDSPVYVKERTDLCAFAISDTDDISVDEISIDERDIKIGESADFTVLVSNNGSNTVENITFDISDGLGYSEKVDVTVNLASGDHAFVALPYVAPDNYTKTELTVSASSRELRESDLTNNTAKTEIGVARIVVSESEVSKIGDSFIIDSMITNESDVYTDIFTVSLYSDSECTNRISTVNINGAQARDTLAVKFEIPKNYIPFDEDDRTVVYVKAEGDYVTESFGSFVLNNITDECMHSVTDVDIEEATCTSVGYKKVVCLGCGEVLEDTTIPALGHDIANGECRNCGLKVIDISVNSSVRLAHDGNNKNWLRFVPEADGRYYFYSDSQRDTCGQILDEDMNSIYYNDDGGSENNFLIEFYAEAGKVYYLTSMLYSSGSYADNLKLVLSDNFSGTHSYEETGRTNATCTSDGEVNYTCSGCGYEYTEYLEKTGHIAVKLDGKPATCTDKGLTDGTKCSVCGKVLTAQKEIPMLSHKSETVKGKSATCTEKGLTDGTKCSVCGKVLTAQKEIPMLGHKSETVKGKSATCTEKGLTDGTKCSVCGVVLIAQKEIPALGHKFENGKCTVCSASDPGYKPAEKPTEKPTEAPIEKPTDNTTKPAEKPTSPVTEKPTEKPTENPNEPTTNKPDEPTTKPDGKKELSLVEGCKQVLDKVKKTVSVVLEKASGMTLDDFIAMFTDGIKIENDKNGLVYNGMKFKHGDDEYTVIVKGDTEADGKITAADARRILRISARLESPDEVTSAAADIDSNSKISAAEARAVLRYAARLSKSLESELPK